MRDAGFLQRFGGDQNHFRVGFRRRGADQLDTGLPQLAVAFHLLALALAIIVCLWTVILAAIFRFWRVDQYAGSLMIPYLLWVTFATVLNYQILRLN